MRAIAAAALSPFTLAALLAAPLARADDTPDATLRAEDVSTYEREAIDAALASLHETPDPSPEGKTLDGIDIVTLDVIEARDPVPGFVNVLHATTRRYVVDREILLRPGEPYRGVAVEESIRNLRRLPQLSLVLAVPVRGSAPGHVRLLVLTKDVWSLRLNSNFAVSSGGLESLTLQPSEINFLGTHQSASLFFRMDPATWTGGVGYRAPRLEGTRSILVANANVITNRATGSPEGSYGAVLAYQPLFSAHTEWAWDSQVSWDREVSRRFVNAREALFVSTAATERNRVPWQYDVRLFLAQESITRSFGWDVKHDFSLGGSVDLRSYTTGDVRAYDPAAVAQFVSRYVPRSDDRAGPFVQYRGYRTRFIRVLDFETLGLQEDYRLGHDVSLRVYPLARALGSSRDVIGVYAAANYTVAMGDGLARASIESTNEMEVDRVSDGAVAGGGEIVTPSLGFGRFVYNAHVLSRYRNYLNRATFLGGDSRLRGYPTSFFVGKDLVESNLEFRTRPVEILHSMELGAAVFYDVGDAFNGFDNIRPKQSVGVGWRSLFPQLDRLVLRVDFGFPIGEGARIPGVTPFSFYIAFEQAFSLPQTTGASLPSGAP